MKLGISSKLKPRLNFKPKARGRLNIKPKTEPLRPKDIKLGGMEITYRDIRELKMDPRNTRTHSKAQIEQIKQSMIEFGWTNPAILKGDVYVAGHGRALAYKLCLKEGVKIAGADGHNIPCIQRDDMTDRQRRAYVIADNRLAELAGWDMDLLKDELNQLLALEKVDVAVTGFDMNFLETGKMDGGPSEFETRDKKGDVIALKDASEVDFEMEGDFDFPIIRPDRILDLSKVKEIATWAGRGSEERGAKRWFYNFNSDSQVDLDWARTMLGFYVDDQRFEAWYTEPHKYVKWALNVGLWGAVGPNYSTYFDWPRAMRLFNIYRSRWVTRYMQEAGINVVPDFTCAPDDMEAACEGLKGITTVALQAHQSYDTEDKRKKKKQVIDYMMKTLEPEIVLLYAPADRLRIFPSLTKADKVILVEPRARVRQRRVKAKLKGEE